MAQEPIGPAEGEALRRRGKGDPNAYARNRFRVGDRVRFTPEADAQFSGLRFKTGVVLGFSRTEDNLVRIRRGRGNPELYHIDLLEKCDEPTR